MSKRLYKVHDMLFDLDKGYTSFNEKHSGVSKYEFLKRMIRYTGSESDKTMFFSMLSAELDTYNTEEISMLEEIKKRYDTLHSLIERAQENGNDNIVIECLNEFVDGFQAALVGEQENAKYHIDSFSLVKPASGRPTIKSPLSTIVYKNGEYTLRQIPPVGEDYIILNGIGNLYMFFSYEHSLVDSFVESVYACIDTATDNGGLNLSDTVVVIQAMNDEIRSFMSGITGCSKRSYNNDIIKTVFGVQYLIKNLTVYKIPYIIEDAKFCIYAYE